MQAMSKFSPAAWANHFFRSESRLPAVRFLVLFFLLSSLPDLIRQSMRRLSFRGPSASSQEPQLRMDHRVKPGGDEEKASQFDITGAKLATRSKIAPRERITSSSRLHGVG
jgi:hypothetical protein